MFLTKLLVFTGIVYAARTANAQGLSGEPCNANSDVCIGGRICYEAPTSFTLLTSECTPSSETCYCFDSEATCESSDDCDDGERCYRGSVSGQDVSYCLACGVPLDMFEDLEWEYVDEDPLTCPSQSPDGSTPTPSPTSVASANESGGDQNDENDDNDGDDDDDDEDEEVCVSVDVLSSYTPEELVFPTHRRASVLCDIYDNCATPGHMVLYQERPMMMKTYCEQTHGCSRRVKLVNSPRMRTALRIPSKSNHLQFLAFAAKLQSRTEEMVLSGLVRLGL